MGSVLDVTLAQNMHTLMQAFDSIIVRTSLVKSFLVVY